jgi:WD40 repeat protein
LIGSLMARSPYPGLRPFDRDEADVFFGRERHVDAMVDRLAQRRLLVVTGNSACGKSSLVRAGLLEALETGLMSAAGPVWRFATLRPGEHPMMELARSLVEAIDGGERFPGDVGLRQAGLERGPLSLIEELGERPLADNANLLIVVDQFEELFRFKGLAEREEAEAFVALLLASALQNEIPALRIYVVMTMRSDFLGHCADFDGLAEAVNDAQYLCPRLTREQSAMAIEGPAQVFQGTVEPRLVTRILNDMGTDPDRLPLMQHALMRLWERACAPNRNYPVLRLDDYLTEGGIKGSLSRHADEIFDEIAGTASGRGETTRRLFCLLTEGEGETARRRLARVDDLVEVAGEPLEEIVTVADAFRSPGRSFLMPPHDRSLTPETFLDITHESLIRQWQKLSGWARAEASSAEQYREIERRARRWAADEAGLWDGIDLDLALAWRDKERPTAAWAKRYGGDFPLAMRYLDESHIGSRRSRAEISLHQSRFLTQRALEALRDDKPELAALIARAALPADMDAPDRPPWYPAVSVLAEAQSYDRQPAVLRGHESFVNGAAFSPDGSRVVTASADGTARVWHATTGALLFVLSGHTAEVNSAVFSPDGKHILTASADHTARLWDASTGGLAIVLQGHSCFVIDAAFSRDGKRIVTASADRTARLWDAITGQSYASLQGHIDSVNGAAFSPDGTRIVTVSNDCMIRHWDTATCEEIIAFRGHDRAIYTVAFSPDGRRVLTASADHTARQWDTINHVPLAFLAGHDAEVNSAVFSPNGIHILTASADDTARLWDADTGDEIAVLRGHNDCVNRAAFDPEGRRAVTAAADSTGRLWDVSTDAQVVILAGHTNEVHSCTFSPDGSRIVTGSWDHTARVWDAGIGNPIALLEGHTGDVKGAAFSRDGQRIVTISGDGTARLWDTWNNSERAVLRGHESFINHAAFSPDGLSLVTASADRTARLWQVPEATEYAVLRGHQSFVNHATFSPDGTRVVSSSADRTCRIWNASSGDLLAVLQGHQSYVNNAAFSLDGARIVTASADRTARLWDATTGAQIAVLRGHMNVVTSAEFSPDGARVVTASEDHTARLWDGMTGAPLGAPLFGHRSVVIRARFSPDGARIITASVDRTARLWDAATGAQVAVLHGHSGSVHDVAISPKGTWIATASADCTVRLWPIWPLLTLDVIVYADVSALRALTDDERESLFLTKADTGAALPQPIATATDSGAVCDRLAGNPFDPRKRAPGMQFDRIDVENAIPACEAATHAAPDEPRFRYQLGRALARANKALEAAEHYRGAAKVGYAAAQLDLGAAYENGSGVDRDRAEAVTFYRQAAEGGCVAAYFRVGRCYWEGVGISVDRLEALRWFERGADAGDPFSHRRLAELYESGEQLGEDFEKALFHHAVATRLLEEAGEESEAVDARVRRGSIARALPPQVAVRVARAATAWRPKALSSPAAELPSGSALSAILHPEHA